MRMDSSGDAGFMEAMVAFMVVTIVLTGFMGALATTTVTTADPTGSLDPDRFQGTLEDGTFVPGFMDYIEGFMWSQGCEGVSVMVDVPLFGGVSGPYTVGTLDGALYTRSVPGTVTDEFGREVPAVFEVVVAV